MSDNAAPGRDQDAELVRVLEQHRRHLRAIAYRMLGSLAEADDAVQETWVRFAAAGVEGATAARAGDFDRLMELLGPDVVIRTDGGPAGPGVSVVMRGAAQIARATIATASPQADFIPVMVNGVAGMLITGRGRPVSLIAATITGSRITAMDGITDLDRLARLGLAALIPGSRD